MYDDKILRVLAQANDPRFRKMRWVLARAHQAQEHQVRLLVYYHRQVFLRLALYGLRPCPNTFFCGRPIIRQGVRGPWPAECTVCARASEKNRKAAKRREANAPTRLGAWTEGLLEVEIEMVEARVLERAEIEKLMEEGRPEQFGTKASSGAEASPLAEDDNRDDYETRQKSVGPGDVNWNGAWFEIATAWHQARDWAVDDLMAELELAPKRYKRLLNQGLGGGDEGKPFKRRPTEPYDTWKPGELWLRGTDDPSCTTKYKGMLYPARIAALLRARDDQERYLRRLLAQDGSLAHSLDTERATQALGLSPSPRAFRPPEDREPVEDYEREAMEREVASTRPPDRAEVAKRLAEGDKRLEGELVAATATDAESDNPTNS
jgi:hypothetical protein